MITEERIESNYNAWIDRLRKYKCYSDSFIEEYGNIIKGASFGRLKESGAAYVGSLLEITMNKSCFFGVKMNDLFKTSKWCIEIDVNSLLRVLLLQHVSRALLHVPNLNKYTLERGVLYEFNNNKTVSMKAGELSNFMVLEHGIKLKTEEYEAIRIMDVAESTYYSNPLSNIVKSINLMVEAELRQEYIKKTK